MEKVFQMFMDGVNGFPDDFMAEGREKGIPTQRDDIEVTGTITEGAVNSINKTGK